jgi:hypothetical protein
MANKRVEEQITNDLGCIYIEENPGSLILHPQSVDYMVKVKLGTLKNVLLN